MTDIAYSAAPEGYKGIEGSKSLDPVTGVRGMSGRLATVLAALLLVVALPAAAERQEAPVLCTGWGTVGQSPDPKDATLYHWRLTFAGGCEGDMRGPYVMHAAGGGTSTGLGLFDGSGVLQNLDLLLDVTFRSLTTGAVIARQEAWVAPITTYPIVTPYIVEHVGETGGNQDGAGVIFNHLFAKCGEGSSPAAVSLDLKLI